LLLRSPREHDRDSLRVERSPALAEDAASGQFGGFGSDDIAISPDLPVPDADHRVVCPTCEETVAQRFSGDRWGVNTKKGWLK
jgi:hypothetical protein